MSLTSTVQQRDAAMAAVYAAFGDDAIVLYREDLGAGNGPHYYGTWKAIKQPLKEVLQSIIGRMS